MCSRVGFSAGYFIQQKNPDPEDKEPKSGEFFKNLDTLENPDGRKTVKRNFFLINFEHILNFC